MAEALPTARDERIRKITRIVLTIAIIGGIVHQLGPRIYNRGGNLEFNWRLWDWFIEDAAISFAYARNWAAGDGLVAFPGEERIEGYSNPLWVAIIAFFYLFGIEGFVSAKWLGLLMGSTTIFLSWKIMQEMIGDKRSLAALIAPVMLAAFPPFAFWNTGGLENGLFCLMLAGGMWRTLVEARTGGYPWSSLFFLGVATTRPEGIMYSAWGGFVFMVLQLREGRGLKTTLQWLATFFAPFLVYHGLRYQYFGWEFPNTYYAKLGNRDFKPFAWKARGWRQIREFGWVTFSGAWLPIYFAGLIGIRKRRTSIIIGASLLVYFLIFYPSTPLVEELSWWPKNLPAPGFWDEVRVYTLAFLAAVLPWLAFGQKGSAGRIMSWGMMILTLAFYIRSQGDWANGYRWMSFLSVPQAILLSMGMYEIGQWFQRRRDARQGIESDGLLHKPGWLMVTALGVAALPGYMVHTDWFYSKRVTGPFSVKKRAEYTMSVTRKLWLDEPISNIDVDMGAHMYWSEHHMVDMAGLVDIPIAMHNFSQRRAMEEYIWEERNPQIAHVHGSWAKTSRIPSYKQWRDGYFEIAPFPAGRTTNHIGTHVRRDLVFDTNEWSGPANRQARFARGVTFHGFETPSPEVSVKKAFYLRIGVGYAPDRNEQQEREDVRFLGFLSGDDGTVFTFDIEPAYGWMDTSEWRPKEIWNGHLVHVLPEELPAGTYDFGFVAIAGDGTIIPPLAPEEQPEGSEAIFPAEGEAVFSPHEVRFADAFVVGEPGFGEEAANADIRKATELAREGRCKQAHRHVGLGMRHLPRAQQWHERRRDDIRDVMATCFARQAMSAANTEDKIEAIRMSRHWDFRHEALHEAQDALSAPYMEAGLQAREAEDWQRAFDAFSAAVAIKPALAWARKYTEEARDHRHGIDPESLEKAEQDREERRLKREKEAEERASKQKKTLTER